MDSKIEQKNDFKVILIRLYKLIFDIHDEKLDKHTTQKSLRPVILDLRSSISKSKKIAFVLFLYAFGVLISYACISQMLAPAGEKAVTSDIIRISPGMDIMKVGVLLSEKGLIKNPLMFQLTGIFNGASRSIKAGDYAINSNMSITEILKHLVSGDTVLYKFTIPEGLTLSEIARLWEENNFGTSAKFIEATKDNALRQKYHINSDSLEGYILPNTYMFPYAISEHEAVEVILKQFSKDVLPLMEKKSPEMKLSLNEIITFASIIEKEAKTEEERPIVSAVYHNRLKKGMKLESCPTVLYGLGYPNRELTYDDLRNASLPYNTYVYSGLPPGPICNPGIKSIIAALNPTKDNYLYFVSKNDGTHYFAQDYNDFLNAKKKYQGG